jgi:hypothetical protein
MRVKLDRHAQESKKIVFRPFMYIYILPLREQVACCDVGFG